MLMLILVIVYQYTAAEPLSLFCINVQSILPFYNTSFVSLGKSLIFTSYRILEQQNFKKDGKKIDHVIFFSLNKVSF